MPYKCNLCEEMIQVSQMRFGVILERDQFGRGVKANVCRPCLQHTSDVFYGRK